MNKMLLFFILISSCFQNGTGNEWPQASNKILVLYLSRTHNTKAIAEIIQNEVGGDLVAVELDNPYPEDYDAIVKQVARENATGYLPPLKTRIDLDKYSTIFIGFPTWGMQLPPPIKSFLVTSDLGGKTVIPFNTNAGYGVGSSFRTVKELCVDCKILEGFQIKGGVERDGILLAIKDEKREQARKLVQAWLAEISSGIPR